MVDNYSMYFKNGKICFSKSSYKNDSNFVVFRSVFYMPCHGEKKYLPKI